MKKLSISIIAILFSLGTVFSQPVSDLGVIPVGITLNSILRLNVTSGGNIEYIVNTINQYTNGIGALPRYETHFTVSSSVDFDVALYADAANFVGVDDVTHTIPLDNLAYTVSGGDASSTLIAGLTALTNTTTTEIIQSATGNAGDVTKNAFVLAWELGTLPSGSGTLLAQSIPSDRYVANVILELYLHN